MNLSPWSFRAVMKIFRFAVDQKLNQLMRSDAFSAIYQRSFGEMDQSTARFFRDTVLPD